MLISYNWLKDYVNVKISPEKLAELFTMSGLSVASIEKKGSDHLIDIEVTSNRPDWLSVIGVARELSAITGEKLSVPAQAEIRGKGQGARVKVRVEESRLCPRYTARVINNVKTMNSPDWLRTKIEAVGLKSVNNIVDITNFCLFETGEPMHAFDLDKISGSEIIVRKAKKGEKIVTIDGIERTLDETILVIADRDKPIAIAGVMGGLNTEVTSSTKNILLEAAYFDPVSIRRTSRKLGISTESSYRFERRVDQDNITNSSDRAVGLMLKMGSGDAGELVDIGDRPKARRQVELNHEHLNKILGAQIRQETAQKILNSLGLATKASSKETITFEIPCLRDDLGNEIDLVEEVARIYGYDKIPQSIPPVAEQPIRIEREAMITANIRRALNALGLDEILAYSLLCRKDAEFASIGATKIVEIKNPLSSEQEVMRPTLLAGLLKTVLWNNNRKAKDLKLFEIGAIYARESEDKFSERPMLAIALQGKAQPASIGGSRPCDFFDLKGIIETLFAELGIENCIFKASKHNFFSNAAAASIEVNGKAIGVLGQVDAKTLKNFEIKDAVFAAELDLGAMIENASLEKHFKELPKFPSISRDITIIVGKDIPNAEIISAINQTTGAILKETRLVDMYCGKQVPEGKVSLTYRLEYQDLKKTLEEKDVSGVHAKILPMLEKKFQARQK